jgi:hypothetical protein
MEVKARFAADLPAPAAAEESASKSCHGRERSHIVAHGSAGHSAFDRRANPPIMLKYSIAAAVVFGAIVLALRWHSAADAASTNVVIAERVLRALERADYDAFVAEADKGVRKILDDDFRALAERHAPRLRSGHDLRPLDDRWRGTVHVSRWKIVFKDGSPDAVLTLGVRDGKVATFAIY